MAAKPFKGGPDDSKDGDTTIAAEPEEPRNRGGGSGEKREARRQQGDGERQQEGKFLRIHQKGIADPVEPQKEIAEAEPPAHKPCTLHAAAAAVKRARHAGSRVTASGSRKANYSASTRKA